MKNTSLLSYKSTGVTGDTSGMTRVTPQAAALDRREAQHRGWQKKTAKRLR